MRKKWLLMVLALTLLFSVCMRRAYAEGTEIRIIPAEITIGEVGQPIPTGNITVNVTVSGVTDLYAWQVKIYYNPDVLMWTGAWYPSGHVFDGKEFQPVTPANGTDTGGTYVLYFATLLGEQPGFNGSGVLCSFNFTAKTTGVVPLVIDTTPPSPYSWLQDGNLGFITFTAYDGQITVISEFQSLIIPLLLISSAVAVLASKKLASKSLS